HPEAKLISPEELRRREREVEELQEKMMKLDPERRRIIRNNNRKYWELIRKIRYINRFFHVMQEFTSASISYKNNKLLIAQASKADFIELTKFIYKKVRPIEAFAAQHFGEIFYLEKTLKSKSE